MRRKKTSQYKSLGEEKLHKILGSSWKYEGETIPYVLIKGYVPDFIKNNIYIEYKEYFRAGDTVKYIAVNYAMKSLKKKFVFCLKYPDKKVRRSSKITMSEWCDKHNIPWYTVETVSKLQ